jgi:hypothetical protein
LVPCSISRSPKIWHWLRNLWLNLSPETTLGCLLRI